VEIKVLYFLRHGIIVHRYLFAIFALSSAACHSWRVNLHKKFSCRW